MTSPQEFGMVQSSAPLPVSELKTNGAQVPMPVPGRWQFSIRTRLILAFLTLLLLSIATGVSGLWYNRSLQHNLEVARLGSNQIEQLESLQISYQSVGSNLDQLLLTRQVSNQSTRLADSLTVFNRQMSGLQTLSLGPTSPALPGIQSQVDELRNEASQINASLEQLNKAVQEGRWAQAQWIRHTQISPLQARMQTYFNQLIQTVKDDLANSTSANESIQNQARLVWMSLSLILLLACLILGLVTSRSILRPLRQWTAVIQRVLDGDFSHIELAPLGDEIGVLTGAISRLTNWLQVAYQTLEAQVAERTHLVELRYQQVQVAALIARDITAASTLEELLEHAVELIRDRFGFYHAGIFLVDERGEYAVLQAATGEAGRTMLAQRHNLKVGGTGLVGFATGSGQPRIALNVDQDPAHYKNPLLPETRSEMALPISIDEKVIGALDVQSQNANAFDEEDIRVLQIVADQLAVAIQNARLLAETQENLKSLQNFYLQYGQQTWQHVGQSRQVVGYEYHRDAVSPVLNRLNEVPEQAASTTLPVSIPLLIRGIAVGSLDVWSDSDSLTSDDIDLLKAISGRLAQTMESARLFEEAHARAAREQAINELTSSISRSLDMDAMLRTAVQEFSQIPKVVEASVHLGPPESVTPVDRRLSGNGHSPTDATPESGSGGSELS